MVLSQSVLRLNRLQCSCVSVHGTFQEARLPVSLHAIRYRLVLTVPSVAGAVLGIDLDDGPHVVAGLPRSGWK